MVKELLGAGRAHCQFPSRLGKTPYGSSCWTQALFTLAMPLSWVYPHLAVWRPSCFKLV